MAREIHIKIEAPPQLAEIRHIVYTGRALGEVEVGPESFGRMIAFWTDACLDTTDYAWEAILKLQSFRSLQALQLPASALYEFIRDHFDVDSGAFRHHQDSWATICASLLAVRLLSKIESGHSILADAGRIVERLTFLIGRKGYERLEQFIRSCEKPQGGFSETPASGRNTISTRAGYGLFLALDLAPRYPSETIDFFKQSLQTVERPNGPWCRAVAYSPDKPHPNAAATHYTVQIFSSSEIRERIDGAQQLWEELQKDMPAFVEACRRDFRFASSPSRTEPPTIDSTRNILIIWQHLFGQKVPLTESESQELIYSIMKDGYVAGFSPESPPNIFSTRNAISIIERIRVAYPETTQHILNTIPIVQNFEEALNRFRVGDGPTFRGYESPEVDLMATHARG